MKLDIPQLSLVVLVGPSGAGKTTFAARHFLPTEVLASDHCRALVADDETDLAATGDAFDVLHYIAAKRLERGRLTVVDATNVQRRARRPLVALAKKYHAMAVAIVFDLPKSVCRQRNRSRDERQIPDRVVGRQHWQMRQSLAGLEKEGFRIVHTLSSVSDVDSATIERYPMPTDKSEETGPFDIIGDVHGCCDELEELLEKLGYVADELPDDGPMQYRKLWHHPDGRRAIFVGDLVDRGPRVLDSLDLARNMVEHGNALMVPGNHENKLLRYFKKGRTKIKYGFDQTLAELRALPEERRQSYEESTREFLESLQSHLVLDGGNLVVAHAGLKEEMHGRISGKERSFALYGDTTGERDEYGLPIRLDWAAGYRGEATVVYGHSPVPSAEWLNRTINVDTGCVFGGKLTALRYPERKLVSINAHKTHTEPIRPIEDHPRDPKLSAQHAADHLLDIDDFTGRLYVETELRRRLKIRRDQGAAALETLSRFAVHPKWIIHLPPTMSPTLTSKRPGYLEAPEEAFDYYRKRGVETVVCQQKHMGSRAIAIVCRDEDVVLRRFGLLDEGIGVVYTRSGRPFFREKPREQGLLERARAALSQSHFWEEFDTDWVCVDAELMPWSFKARPLLKDQYAAVGAAARSTVGRTRELIDKTVARGVDVGNFAASVATREEMIAAYRRAYRNYCWPVEDLDDIHLAPFHLLATEGSTYFDQSHLWHMETISRYFQTGQASSMQRTDYRVVDLHDDDQVQDAIQWWDEMTAAGDEGMVVKPEYYVQRGDRGIVQPALKCRGREYLRIIYGPEYTHEPYLERLRERNVGKKRSLAMREFALGIEGLKRFVAGEPLRRVHECAFAVLAMESEPVDPAL